MTASSARLKELSPEQRALLLKRLAAREVVSTPSAAPKLEPCLSFAQERWLFHDRLAPADPAHAIFGGLRLYGVLDLAALQSALDSILARHPPLRSSFSMRDGTPRIQIRQLGSFPLSQTDVSNESAEARLQTAYEAEIATGFALDQDLLIRARLLQLANEDHALLFAMHHIASDGWSLGVFLEELAELYRAKREARAPRLAALDFSYTDFVHWQRDRLARAGMDRALAYWRDHLCDAPTLTDLQSDQPGGGLHPDGTRDLTGDAVEATIPPEIAAKLSSLGTEHGASLFATLLAAYFVLLGRLTGKDDLVIGTPVSGRIREESEPLIGLFLNTLALRARLDARTGFRNTLASVHGTILGGLEHHEVPFDRVVQEVAPERRAADHALFELMFNFTPSPPRALELPGLRAEFLQPPTQACEFSAVLYVTEWQGALELRLTFQKARFSRARMQALLDQYVYLLQDILRDPEKALGQLRLAPPQGLPPPDAPGLHRPVTDCIAQWSEQTPNAPALEWTSGKLSYEALNASITQTAQTIAAHGLQRGDVVAVSGARSAKQVIGMAAVLRAGCVLLTLEPALPESRQAVMLDEAGAQLIVATDEAPQTWLANSGVPMLYGNKMDDAATALPDALSGNHDPAYLFFTSGSTGTPKAVLGTAGGLAQFLDWQRNTFGIGPGDRAAQLTGLSFDVLLRDVFTPISAGATLVLPPQDGGAASTGVLDWLAEQQITLIHSVPSVLQTWLLPADVPALPDLRLLFSAGEPLLGDLVTRWRTCMGTGAQIVNLYGPTETTLAKCAFVVPEPPFTGSQPVGQPIPGAQVLILHPDHSLCAPGEPGEIAIRTPYRTLGYANDSARTAQQFIVNPGAGNAADRLYLTGDLGWRDGAGLLHVLGRSDDQVKIRGVRVEPQEIAALLRAHPDIDTSAVIARKAEEDTAVTLAAYAVPAAGRKPDVAGLRSYLRARLPEALVPAGITLLDALPLTANHKLDRARLPQIAASPSQPSRAARSPQEMLMLQIWSEVLGKRDFGVEEDFFDLGGHSLLALRLLLVIEQRTGVKIPLAALFKSATVAHLAKIAESQTAPSQVVPLWTGGTGHPLWLIHTGGGTIWNYMPLVTALAPDFPVYAIQARGLMDGHEPQDDLRDMAAAYVSLIKAQQPQGPYRLCGHSFGGVLAWEVANQLEKSSDDVEALILVDSRLHHPTDLWFKDQSPGRAVARDLAGAAAIFARFTGGGMEVSEEELIHLSPEEQIARVAGAFEQSELQIGDAATLVESLLAIAQAHRDARLTYTPPVLDVPVTYFQAADGNFPAGDTAATNAWEALTTAAFDGHLVGGDHVTMMTDRHAPELARRLRSVFERVTTAH